MLCDSLDEVLQILQEKIYDKKIYIWGTGVYGNLLGAFLNRCEVDWAGYYDSYTYNTFESINGKKIYPGDGYIDDNGLYILSMKDSEPIRFRLKNEGIEEPNIIRFKSIRIFNELDVALLSNEGVKSRIEKVKDVHKGKRCFVIGNGPSLSLEDLERLNSANEITFASNMIFRCYEETNWRPTYYFVTDPNGIKELIDSNMLEYLSQNCEQMFSRLSIELLEKSKSILNLNLFHQIYSESEDVFSFSDDCSRGVYIGYTVTYVMLQLAVYMGFSEIFLLGVDHTFSREMRKDGKIIEKDVQDHSDLLKGEKVLYFRIDQVTLAYMSAKVYADTHGISIYNATRGGALEVFPRIDFDIVIGNNQ